MAQLDPVIFREIPVIQKIIQDETWYEGERRGCGVSPNDPVVRENVCRTVLRIGQELRDTIAAQVAANPGPTMLPLPSTRHDQAA